MKVLAVIALLAVVAYASEEAEEHVLLSGHSKDFVGELQENGAILMFDSSPDMSMFNTALFGIPSCKLGPRIGNPICMAKCISRHHKGGYCNGKTCTCVD